MLALRRLPTVLAVVTLAAAALLVSAPPASAATVTVSTWNELTTAAADTGVDTIVLGADITAPENAYLNLQYRTVTLDLAGNELTIANIVGLSAAAIFARGADITIADSVGTGTLTAVGGSYRAGIEFWNSSDRVTITGGTVTAIGGGWGAGIGGGSDFNGGTVVMSGGILHATGGVWASAIGSGDDAGGEGTITLLGPTNAGDIPAMADRTPVTLANPVTGTTATLTAQPATPSQGSLGTVDIAFSYEVTFTDGTSTLGTAVVEYGSTVDPDDIPADPSGPELTLTSWASDPAGIATTDPITAPVTFTAQFETTELDVRTVFGNGRADDVATVAYGSTYSVPTTAPTREGYEFTGWSVSPADADPAKVTVDATWTAQWAEVESDVSVDTDDDALAQTGTMTTSIAPAIAALLAAGAALLIARRRIQ